jgi:putative acetyltransferase
MAVTIAIESPLQDEVRELVSQLNDHLLPLSPLEFQFKMTVEQMADAETTVFVARNDAGRAVGIGALRVISADEGEVKRMYTSQSVRGQRVGSALLEAIERLAREKGMSHLLLETGTGDGMIGAQRLYANSGFSLRGPFLDYPESEWSLFYEKRIAAPAVA